MGKEEKMSSRETSQALPISRNQLLHSESVCSITMLFRGLLAKAGMDEWCAQALEEGEEECMGRKSDQRRRDDWSRRGREPLSGRTKKKKEKRCSLGGFHTFFSLHLIVPRVVRPKSGGLYERFVCCD